MSTSEIRSFNTYIFLENMAYDLSDISVDRIKKEIIDLIPIISYEENMKEFRKFYRRGRIYTYYECCAYENKMSTVYLVKCLVNAIGLGILLIPVRLVATLIREIDRETQEEARKEYEWDPEEYLPLPEDDEALFQIENGNVEQLKVQTKVPPQSPKKYLCPPIIIKIPAEYRLLPDDGKIIVPDREEPADENDSNTIIARSKFKKLG